MTKHLRRIIKGFIMSFLICACYLFYMREAISDYNKGSKTVVTRSIRSKDISPPAISICPHPSFKPSKLKDFNFPIRDLFHFPHLVENANLSHVDPSILFHKVAYTLEDLILRIDHWNLTLKHGDNLIKDNHQELVINLKTVPTWSMGNCFLLRFNQSFFAPKSWNMLAWGIFNMIYNSSLNQEDIPRSFTFYFTPLNHWQGITNTKWSGTVPLKIDTNLEFPLEGDLILTRTEKHLHKDSLDALDQPPPDTKNCINLEDYLKSQNCPNPCVPVLFEGLFEPPFKLCSNFKDHFCIIYNGYLTKQLNRCGNIPIQSSYKGEAIFKSGVSLLHNTETIRKTILFKQWWRFYSDDVTIQEEIDVYELKYLVASLGGILSLFIGYSIFNILDIIIENVLNRLNYK